MTFALGKGSRNQLAGVQPRLVSVVELAITLTPQDFSVLDGLRTLDEQRALVRSGASRTMNSRHLPQPDGYGHAVDLVPWVNGKPRWEWPLIFPIALAVQRAAETLGVSLVWGAVWDRRLEDLGTTTIALQGSIDGYKLRHPGPDFLDGPHYQLA